MQSSRYYDTVFQSKKEFTKSCLVLYFSFILVTWSLLQISLTDCFENNDNIHMKIPLIYAQDYDGGNGNGEASYDNGDSDVEEPSLDKEDSQEKDVGQEDAPEELTLSVDGQDESVDVSRLVGSGPSGIDITSQLPSGDPQPLFVSLPPLPGGPLPPGSLPPIPGSPLPPGSPIPPGGGPTPPEDLSPLLGDLPPEDLSPEDLSPLLGRPITTTEDLSPEDLSPLLGDLPPHDGYHDDDDDENAEDDDGEKEEEDEDSDDKDNS